MNDSYQAIYDAVRSRISMCDPTSAITEAARQAFDISHMLPIIQQEFMIAAGEMARPSVVYKPTLAQDGDQWCALLGSNIAEGVVGFGPSPDEAMREFDKAWHTKLPDRTVNRRTS